jgi:NAD(P)H-hydrate repair Nnr-like enzyme with NAD(P)H-hydrate epimerase domain
MIEPSDTSNQQEHKDSIFSSITTEIDSLNVDAAEFLPSAVVQNTTENEKEQTAAAIVILGTGNNLCKEDN